MDLPIHKIVGTIVGTEWNIGIASYGYFRVTVTVKVTGSESAAVFDVMTKIALTGDPPVILGTPSVPETGGIAIGVGNKDKVIRTILIDIHGLHPERVTIRIERTGQYVPGKIPVLVVHVSGGSRRRGIAGVNLESKVRQSISIEISHFNKGTSTYNNVVQFFL
jgi:hypothetical protein